MTNDRDTRSVSPSARISGEVSVPGDKSISHRAAMLAALAGGESAIDGFLTSEDCLNTLRALESMGAGVRRVGESVTIRGTSGRFTQPAQTLDMGNSGTGIRLMCGLIAGQKITAELSGDDSLRSRPMNRIRDPLLMMGAKIELLGDRGCAPVRICGGDLHAIEYRLPVASAQVKSCIMLAAMCARGTTTIEEPEPTRDHTERMFKALGLPVTVCGKTIRVTGSGTPPLLTPFRLQVPRDFSSAAFWIVAAASRPGASVLLRSVGLNPRRTALLDVMRRMGAEISILNRSEMGGEDIGDIRVNGTRLRATEIGGPEIPNLIDEIPVLAVAAALAEGTTTIRDAAELRVKESDRIATTGETLALAGVKVAQHPDGLTITGSDRICGQVEIDSRGDHRIAMAGAILALSADDPLTIRHVSCIATSYPSFWSDMEKVTGQNAE